MGYWKMNITCQKSFSASCVKISQCKLSRTSDLTMSNYSSCWLISSLVTVGVESILPSSSNKYFILSSKHRIDNFIDLFFALLLNKKEVSVVSVWEQTYRSLSSQFFSTPEMFCKNCSLINVLNNTFLFFLSIIYPLLLLHLSFLSLLVRLTFMAAYTSYCRGFWFIMLSLLCCAFIEIQPSFSC